MNKIYH